STLTISCASSTNFLKVFNNDAFQPNAITLTGDGAFVQSVNTEFGIIGADANTTFRFDAASAGAVALIVGGINIIVVTPTANRTYTIGNPATTSVVTRLIIINASTSFIITLAGGVLTNTTGQSYIPPGGSFEGNFFSNSKWNAIPVVQAGQTTLAGGLSPFIT